MKLTVQEKARSATIIKVKTKKILKEHAKRQRQRDERFRYLYELQDKYHRGEISIDPDDPRTVRGLSKAEVDFILEDSNELYEDWRDNNYLEKEE